MFQKAKERIYELNIKLKVMKKSVLFLLVFFTVSAGVASAQEFKFKDLFKFDEKGSEFNYGFISAGGGAQVYWGDLQDQRPRADRFGLSVDASLGKMINPYLGGRIQWAGSRVHGTTRAGNKFQGGKIANSSLYKNDFNLSYLHVDLLWNLSNTFGGPREDRFLDIVPFAGAGWVLADKTEAKPNNRYAIDGGMMAQFRLSPVVDIILELRGMVAPHGLDNVVTGNKRWFYKKTDIATSATIGVAYNFGRAQEEVIVEAIDLTPYNNRIGALERDLTASQDRATRLARDLEAEKAQEKTVINNNYLVSDLAVWFEIGKSKLSEKEEINLGYVADAIKKAAADKVYTIYGSADKQTGSPVYNQRLSEQRAQAVYDALVKNGVSASQLRLNPVGDTQAKFNKALLNRVAIIQSNN
jgi:outer membrane protein OmpA-like peptidoglycan-associated protein